MDSNVGWLDILNACLRTYAIQSRGSRWADVHGYTRSTVGPLSSVCVTALYFNRGMLVFARSASRATRLNVTRGVALPSPIL